MSIALSFANQICRAHACLAAKQGQIEMIGHRRRGPPSSQSFIHRFTGFSSHHSLKSHTRSLRSVYPDHPTSTRYVRKLFVPTLCREQGHPSVQRQSSDFTFELRDEDEAEAIIVVAVVGVVVVAIRRPAILRPDNFVGIVPTPAANNTVRTLDGCPFLFKLQFEISSLCRILSCTFCLNALASACSVNAVNGVICLWCSFCVQRHSIKFCSYVLNF